jgi:hypothetical protein
MREDEVVATTVDIELVTQIAGRHGGAFDVPAGRPWSPRAWASGFTGA